MLPAANWIASLLIRRCRNGKMDAGCWMLDARWQAGCPIPGLPGSFPYANRGEITK